MVWCAVSMFEAGVFRTRLEKSENECRSLLPKRQIDWILLPRAAATRSAS